MIVSYLMPRMLSQPSKMNDYCSAPTDVVPVPLFVCLSVPEFYRTSGDNPAQVPSGLPLLPDSLLQILPISFIANTYYTYCVLTKILIFSPPFLLCTISR